MFKRLLIANRGEIACRIIETAKSMGITAVAIYSEADRHARHTQLADEAYCIGPAVASESYLSIEKIIQLAKTQHIEAIHPGYGFLAENAQFAQACQDQGIQFVGPPPSVIDAMGSKSEAKALLEKANVPLVPGYHGNDQSESRLLSEAKQIGFPVLLKAAMGGGGKGMRIVEHEHEFSDALAGAKREAQKSFANDEMIIEKYLNHARHIECQIIADSHGQSVHLFERDCSLQRRHQKIIEEAPAPNFSAELRSRLTHTALIVAETIGYVNAGTIEFLVDGDEFYFMEMNTRLQVEHPVTEMITGVDLVEWQLQVAAGQSLPRAQDQIQDLGHAIEVRIYAEDPDKGFLPSTGMITVLSHPEPTAWCRFDTGFRSGDEVSPYYDPMLAKLIVHGDDRAQCLERLNLALEKTHIVGVKTNIDFVRKLIQEPEFIQANCGTQFLSGRETAYLSTGEQCDIAIVALAFADWLKQSALPANTPHDPFSPWGEANAWQANLPHSCQFSYLYHNTELNVTLEFTPELRFIFNDKYYSVTGSQTDHQLQLSINAQDYELSLYESTQGYTIFGLAETYEFSQSATHANDSGDHDQQLTAPMPASIVALYVKPGDTVATGDKLMVLEAMKMEHTIKAPRDGIIDAVHVQLGEQVDEGLELLSIGEIQGTQ